MFLLTFLENEMKFHDEKKTELNFLKALKIPKNVLTLLFSFL